LSKFVFTAAADLSAGPRTKSPRPLVFQDRRSGPHSRGESSGRAAIKKNHRLCGSPVFSPVFSLVFRGAAVFSDLWSLGFPSVPLGIDTPGGLGLSGISLPVIRVHHRAFFSGPKRGTRSSIRSAKNSVAPGFYLSVYPTPSWGRMQCGKSSLIYRGGGSTNPPAVIQTWSE
jgi:hypothetical protein